MSLVLDFLKNIPHDIENLAVNTARLPVQFSENFSNTFANLGNRLGGGQDQTIQQNMGGNDPLNSALKFSQATGTNRQLLGDVAQAGLYALPGAGTAKTALGTVAKSAAIGAGVGGASNVASAFGQGGPQNYGLDFLQGAGAGAVLGGAGGAAHGIISDVKASRLAKLEDQNKIAKELKPDVGPAVARDVAPAVAQTNDPNIVKGIISNDISKKVPSPTPTAAEAIPQPSVSEPASLGQGSGEATPIPTPDLEGKQRSFLETVQKSDTSHPDLVKASKELQQTYEQKKNAELMQKAQESVNKDYTGSLSKVLSEEKPSDSDVATGLEIMRRAQNEGRIDEAVNVADALDKKLRESGRAVQAASIWSRLSPEGILQLATRKLRQARELNPKNIPKETSTAQEIQNAVEGATPQPDTGMVRKAVQDVANGQQALRLEGVETRPGEVENTGQALAKNVEKAAAPPVQKQVDQLVKELTAKVKQEYLEPKVQAKTPPLDILKEVFGRFGEAKDAYPYAQKILQDKYANVPEMSDALDKFFKSDLGLPASGTTINSAIRNQLSKNGDRISQTILKSWEEQGQTVETTANALVKEGFDKESAGLLAKEVTNRLNQQIAEAKRSVLDRMSQEVPDRAKGTYLEKINKLSNLGALDQQDYLQLARGKLNLPNLDTATATKLSELSQKLQGLPEGHEKYSIVRQIQNTIGEAIPQSKGDIAREAVGLPRTIMASGDFSAGFRQALTYATSHPIKFAQEFPKQFTYFKQAFKNKDSEAFDAMMADIRSHEDYNWLEKSGLAITEPVGHSSSIREEQFMASGLGEKIPALGRLVSASNYAYTGLLNGLRANEFYGQLEHLKYANIPITDDLVKGLAKVINTSTGRGDLGRFERASGELSTILFAPRLIASRLSVLDPRYYINLPAPARQEALRGLLGLSAFATGILGLGKLGGLNVGVDPRSSDFGKIRKGDTRYDLLGGFSQYIRLGAQLATGQKINSTTGAQTTLGKGVVGSRLDVATNFLQGKENPTVSFVTTLLKGKDVSGNNILTPKGVSQQVIQRFIPLLGQDMADLFTHPNSGNKILSGALGAFGVGLQTYGVQDEPISSGAQNRLDFLKQGGVDQQQINTEKSFFQNLRVASGRQQNVSDEINKDLAKGDLQAATQAAATYNQQLISQLKPFVQKNRDTLTKDRNFVLKELSSSLINLDQASIMQRLQSIQQNPTKYGLPVPKLTGVGNQ